MKGGLYDDRLQLPKGVRQMMATIPLNLDQPGSTLGIEKKTYMKNCIMFNRKVLAERFKH